MGYRVILWGGGEACAREKYSLLLKRESGKLRMEMSWSKEEERPVSERGIFFQHRLVVARRFSKEIEIGIELYFVEGATTAG